MKINRSQSLKPAEKHHQRRASEAAEPGPGLETQPGSGFGREAEPTPEPGPETASESQQTAANNRIEGIDVEDVLPPDGASSELQPQDQAPGEIPAAAAPAAVFPSDQGGAVGSEEAERRVSPSESEVKLLDSSSR